MSGNKKDPKQLSRDDVNDSSLESRPEESTPVGVSERKLKWKLDLFILPLLASIFFLAVIGQSNIGNAYKAGLAEDLSLTPKMFANVNSLFLVGDVVGQLPATLLLRQLGPHRQVCKDVSPSISCPNVLAWLVCWCNDRMGTLNYWRIIFEELRHPRRLPRLHRRRRIYDPRCLALPVFLV
jgi:hypothetical protein